MSDAFEILTELIDHAGSPREEAAWSRIQSEVERLRGEKAKAEAGLALHIGLLEQAQQRVNELEGAIREARPETLARWFDQHDRERLAAQMGVTEAEISDYMLSGMEVQRDLRALAAALKNTEKEQV